MPSRRLTLVNRYGLHARACARLLAIAAQFDSDITLRKDERIASARSLTRLLMLAAGPGSELDVLAEGPDADAALDALEALVNNRFDEGE